MSTICHNFTCDCGARVQVWFSQIIEAMACGIPVVATNIGGPTEIISNEKDGFLVPLSAKPFADVLIRLLEDESLRQQIACHAREKIGIHFSMARQMQLIENLYKEYLPQRTN